MTKFKAKTVEVVALTVSLSPHGRLHVERGSDSSTVPNEIANRILGSFEAGNASGILHLASVELREDLPITLSFWREFGRSFLAHLCAMPDLEEKRQSNEIPAPKAEELSQVIAAAPPILGGEYLSTNLLEQYWKELQVLVQRRLDEFPGSAAEFLNALNPAWNLIGRVCFHLAENKQNVAQPFAFLATYTSRLSAKSKPQHLPLGRAIDEFSNANNKNALLTLLKPVQLATEKSAFLKSLVDSGEIYHPLAWTPAEAYRFLKEIPAYEAAGVLVRVPDWWRAKRPSRPEVRVTVGNKEASGLGFDALMDFDVSLSLDDEPLSEAEWRQILKSTSGLISIKGRWVELDTARLTEVLEHWRRVEASIGDGVSFADAMRLISGASGLGSDVSRPPPSAADWSRIIAGDWLTQILEELRHPENKRYSDPGPELKATLRPYQRAGIEWLWLLHQLRLGACLADDMGLGKTIQVLALLLTIKRQKSGSKTLLVVPASLIGNWLSEAEKFAPSLEIFVLHPSSLSDHSTDTDLQNLAKNADVTITTYGLLTKYGWLADLGWNLAVLDEAQAIKNPGSKQTAAAKAINASHRIALTGTPVENRLSDLWSIFDFICPGLLGTPKILAQFVKEREASNANPYAALRNLVTPYILRRLKTDRSVIADLPEKTEVRAYCGLTKSQAGLYGTAVAELARQIEDVDGIQRRGVILSFLMRFKQICNHPAQWLGDGDFNPKNSGKFARLAEIAEEIASRQEKALIFTQFREMTTPLATYLAELFGREGLILHGETPVKARKALVDSFQREDGPPFFILSLKAGGTGLNLTAASHVIHFDRWWNPAVENQATDRAFRIGQKRNVLVHKFICKGTVEEKIDALIEEKKAMAAELLEGGGEAALTEMSNEDLLRLVSLDINSAMNGA